MALPVEEATTQLVTVNAAIQQLIEGKRIKELRVGSGNFQRLYSYSEITLEALKTLQQELLITIDSYAPAITTFRTNAHIPMVIGKDIF